MKRTKIGVALLLMSLFCTPICFSSCSDGNSDSTLTIANGIDASLLPGHYEFGGNIRENFTLYKDGTCIYGDQEGVWQYNEHSCVLVMNLTDASISAYTIKLLTNESFAAEWSSVKYGTIISSWKRTAL